MLTPDDKAKLAKFAKAAIAKTHKGVASHLTHVDAYYINNRFVCYVADWSPDTKADKILMVLRALVKHEQERLEKMHGEQSWANMGWDHVLNGLTNRTHHRMHEPFDYGNEICEMALAVETKK